ncbi:MAG: YdcF family protein [Bryobacteraceae bacterium]|nr:YdcF family protein [Bryobacteraceae bacterium]
MAGRQRRWLWLAPLALIAAAALLHPFWLSALGHYLVAAEPPRKADAALVLGGDPEGTRLRTAAELVRSGHTPVVYVSGPFGSWDYHESELAINWAVKKGYPREWFVPLPHFAKSTRDEAAAVLPELRRRKVSRLLLVTSDFHTRRATRLFRNAAPDLEIITIAAPDRYFKAAEWWHHREGRKTFLIEWMKTVSEWLGL